MDEFNKMFKNQNVNNYATAIIFGFATFNFFNTIGTMIFGDVLDAGSAWVWKAFWVSLCVYLLLILVAWWVNSMAKG